MSTGMICLAEMWVAFLQEQAAGLHAMGMMGYVELKKRLMSTTAFLVASGSLIAMSAGGPSAACPFAIGGSAALCYQWLLQQSVDTIPSKVPYRVTVKVCSFMSNCMQVCVDQVNRHIIIKISSLYRCTVVHDA